MQIAVASGYTGQSLVELTNIESTLETSILAMSILGLFCTQRFRVFEKKFYARYIFGLQDHGIKKIQYTYPVDDMPYYLNVPEERSFAITVSVVCKLHVHTEHM